MGGRGGSFGKGVQAFSYNANGRTMYVQRGAGGACPSERTGEKRTEFRFSCKKGIYTERIQDVYS